MLLSEFWIGEILVFSATMLPNANAALSAFAIVSLRLHHSSMTVT